MTVKGARHAPHGNWGESEGYVLVLAHQSCETHVNLILLSLPLHLQVRTQLPAVIELGGRDVGLPSPRGTQGKDGKGGGGTKAGREGNRE